MIEKSYEPSAVEGRIYAEWEQAGAFAAGAGAKPGAEAYSIVIPPPNVTGSLHIGHALNNTIQDLLIRFERMRGKDVLWQPGTDHAGIATQMIVERQLMERQEPTRRELGREKFLEKVWEWKEESGGTILNQLRRLGASCDWSRERFTMDEGLSEAVLKVFVELHKKGLIYRAKRLVNWHPELQTAISDLEVENIEVKGHMWHLRYPLADGKTYKFPIAFDDDGKPTEFETRDYIVVATTRPETMLGDSGVAVNPEDDRYRELIGGEIILPLVGRRIPIVGDEHADPEQGTGAVKITPAHDFNDFQVGERHNLEQINVFTIEAKINDEAPEVYRGLDRFAARKQIIEDLEVLGALDGIEDKKIMVPHDEKTKMVVIEPFLTDQWFVNAEELAKPALASVREGRTKFVPKSWENTYYAWMENIQPWCISRQLWWGHQIPAWYGPDGEVFVDYDEQSAQSAADAHYGKTVELTRDPDVLDTWFSSGLWAFSTLGWPEQTEELKKYYPTSVLVTGFDIIFFWVARMMMTSLEFLHEEPFHTVYVHALVRDERGQKMSKTKGNVINPLELIDGYGADATRFTLAAMAAQGRDLKLSMSRVEGYRNFVTKIWNAARFLEMNECARVEGFDPKSVTQPLNQWIIGATARAVADVTKGIEDFKFNEAANSAYDFVWGSFCDWFVELAKPVMMSGSDADKAETRATAAFALDQILALLHPFMPFVTEELWAETGKHGPARETMLILADWPQLEGLENAAADSELNWLIGLISGIRSVRAEMNVPGGAKVQIEVVGANPETLARIETHRPAIERLARLESITIAEAVPTGAAQLVMGEATFALPLGDIIDLDAEKARLAKDIAKLADEVAKIEKKLNNEQFTSKAPQEVIDDQRQRRDEAEDRRARVEAALNRLS
jgi:valyl-tRNA synthetase